MEKPGRWPPWRGRPTGQGWKEGFPWVTKLIVFPSSLKGGVGWGDNLGDEQHQIKGDVQQGKDGEEDFPGNNCILVETTKESN